MVSAREVGWNPLVPKRRVAGSRPVSGSRLVSCAGRACLALFVTEGPESRLPRPGTTPNLISRAPPDGCTSVNSRKQRVKDRKRLQQRPDHMCWPTPGLRASSIPRNRAGLYAVIAPALAAGSISTCSESPTIKDLTCRPKRTPALSTLSFPGGESFKTFAERVDSFAAKLLDPRRVGTAPLAVHDGSLRVPICRLMHLDLSH